MSNFNILPGIGISSFINLKSDLNSLLDYLRDYFIIFKYHQTLDFDYVLNIPQFQISIFFNHKSQLVNYIELYPSLENNSIQSSNFSYNSHKIIPSFTTLSEIYSFFGPTTPGIINHHKHYVLSYPGISFTFPIPQKHAIHISTHTDSLPFVLPDGSCLILSRIYIYSGNHWKDTSPIPHSTFSFKDSGILDVNLIQNSTIGISEPHSLSFNSTCQDVFNALREPSFISTNNTNKLHKTSIQTYSWKYYNHGIDVVFHHSLHTVIKFIFYTNIPGHHNFNKYNKCQFNILIKNNHSINCETKWNGILKFMGDPLGPPVILNKNFNPFGSTRFFAFPGIIFEILKSGSVASIIVYKKDIISIM